MADVAGLKLCRELYDLSGWNDTFFRWADHGKDSFFGVFVDDGLHPPAYDLGYLLRKLPPYISKDIVEDLQWLDIAPVEVDKNNDVVTWSAGYKSDYKYAHTPEDATCKLAIQLFKQGILKP